MNQRQRLAALRSRRDNQKVSELLTRLESAARGSDNLMPLMVECVENYITLGEICGLLRKVWGEYQSPAWV
jgi:methylmalonyl-CoA mutase N-terminal domain/subunit